MARNNMEKFTTGTGQELWVHTSDKCQGEHCPIHNPSKFAESIGKTHWRDDRSIMERICEHGVGHPDPDTEAAHGIESVHGCDGCCVKVNDQMLADASQAVEDAKAAALDAMRAVQDAEEAHYRLEERYRKQNG